MIFNNEFYKSLLQNYFAESCSKNFSLSGLLIVSPSLGLQGINYLDFIILFDITFL